MFKGKKVIIFDMDGTLIDDYFHPVYTREDAGIESGAVYDKYYDDEREAINAIATFKISNFHELIKN